MNTDLENLSGFGLVQSMASKSNCFSHRTDIEEVLGASQDDIIQHGGLSEAQVEQL
jgi:hypothetical protein